MGPSTPSQNVPNAPSVQPALWLAADIQDALMSATHDLQRLDGLLDDAVQGLMAHFSAVHGQLAQVALSLPGQPEPDPRAQLMAAVSDELRGAITALQFQDMATQLIAHTTRQLRYCADQLARQALGDDPDGDAVVTAPPGRPNPVTQDEMDAGSVELF